MSIINSLLSINMFLLIIDNKSGFVSTFVRHDIVPGTTYSGDDNQINNIRVNLQHNAFNFKEIVNCGIFSTFPLGFWHIEI